MWPWEHLAVGYLAYSLFARAAWRRPPRSRVALAALALGTQFPDLVDKPLAWIVDVLPSGTSLAHSVFVAVPLVALVLAWGHRRGRTETGAAFGLGYLLHLPADVYYVAAYGSTPDPRVLLWPLYAPPAGSQAPGFVVNVSQYFARFLAVASAPGGTLFVVAELALLGGALALWTFDGLPGLPVGGHWSRTRHPEQ